MNHIIYINIKLDDILTSYGIGKHSDFSKSWGPSDLLRYKRTSLYPL